MIENVCCFRTLDNYGKESIAISWNSVVSGVPDIIGFNVYRADLEDFVLVGSNITQGFYLDIEAKLFPGKNYYYKITYITPDGESSLSDAIVYQLYNPKIDGLRQRLYWVLQNTIRRIHIGFELQGENVKFYIAKKVGPKCAVCWDTLSNRATNPRCEVCWGTGITGGYDVFERKIIVFDSAKTLPVTPFGIRITYTPRAVLGNFPVLADGDLFKRQDGTLFMITDITPYYMQNFLIEQIFDIAQLDLGHVGYRITL